MPHKTTTFHPPYLRFDNPADLARIHEQQQMMVARSGAHAPRPSHNPFGGLIKQTPPVKKKVQLTVTVSPNGTVPLGFNCKTTFTASTNIGELDVDECEWRLDFKNPNPNGWALWVGVTDGSVDGVKFDVDYSTYSTPAYASNGNATFRVECLGYKDGSFIGMATSDYITLSFNGPHCIGIHNIELNPGDSYKGGGNGKDPTMTVHLDAPAPPGGQRVDLSVTDKDLGRIFGDGYFTIPAGQTSGAMSWFLGTSKVHSTGKSFNIVVKVNATTGYALIKLTK